MMSYIANDRDACIKSVRRAFSRYNGLTNSAKLESITKLLLDELKLEENNQSFSEQPFLYASKIREKFETEEIGGRSAEVLLQHAISFNFLHRATSGGKSKHPSLSTKVEALSHIALTPLGRAMRSSKRLDNKKEEFKLFLWEYALLERDFDMYGLLIKMTAENDGNIVGKNEMFNRFKTIRNEQIDWMKEKIPNKDFRKEIQSSLPWIGESKLISKRTSQVKQIKKRQFKLDELFNLSETSRGHHYHQRIRWATKYFQHVSGEKLTEKGKSLAGKLPSTNTPQFFWLGPPKECTESRWLSSVDFPESVPAPAWNLLRPVTEEKEPRPEFVEKVANYMEISFDMTRLVNFKQSSLNIVVPYIYFLECQFGARVNIKSLFETVLRENKEKFVCTLRADLSKSHYHLR